MSTARKAPEAASRIDRAVVDETVFDELTQQTIRDARDGKNITHHANADEMFAHLGIGAMDGAGLTIKPSPKCEASHEERVAQASKNVINRHRAGFKKLAE